MQPFKTFQTTIKFYLSSSNYFCTHKKERMFFFKNYIIFSMNYMDQQGKC